MKDSIYILEAIATHYPDDTYLVVVERKEWVGKGEVGKKRLESIMYEVSKVWKKVYAESDVKLYFVIYSTVEINGLIHKDESIRKMII